MSRFDRAAASYDERSGIPPERRAEIVRALAGLTRLAAGDVLLELGAGTGQLGACFPALGVRYVGLDDSAPMLAEFERRRPAGGAPIELIQADVNVTWPVASASVRAVFSSRAVHLFDLQHVVAETLRVARPAGATFVLGRVERDEHGLRSGLRREMRARLAVRGFAPRDGERRQRRILDAFRAGGATPLGPVIAASWSARSTAARVLEDWRAKPGLGGIEPPDETKAAVLAELAERAAARFGSLDAQHDAEERYVLEGVALPARQTPLTMGDMT
ncbi:MAG: class I SAM-dependent methyltransferase [Candidatus Eremiobacteraeota bacterium]|nr:class I SAM-dependent methyltransferase [Candidatus Eremiobacteraeota bacterium]